VNAGLANDPFPLSLGEREKTYKFDSQGSPGETAFQIECKRKHD
jgi:hypothetical protein